MEGGGWVSVVCPLHLAVTVDALFVCFAYDVVEWCEGLGLSAN